MPLRFAFPRWPAARKKREPNHLGVVLSPGRLAVAVVREGGQGKPVLVAYDSFSDDPDLAQVGKWLKKEGLTVESVNFSLPGDDYQMLSMDTPMVPAAERADAMRWRVKDIIDFPVEEACVDCLVLPAPDGSGEGNHSWAVVARRQRIADWMTRSRKAKLGLSSIDIPELALRNLLVLEPQSQATALLRLSSTGGALIVAWKGELCSFRRFNDLNVAHFAAADLMTRQSLLERLALELQRTADAFERQFYGTSIERVWVEQSVPEIDLVQQLAPHVSMRLHAYEMGDFMELGHRVTTGMNRAKAPRVSLVAVGAALRQVIVARDGGAA
ncbi:MAG: hypothetical protein KGI91_03900 [Burkholderiales bacterium]|nr:hypothetical protein [Burkholderiales bacterium]